jgi:hypothetical protein
MRILRKDIWPYQVFIKIPETQKVEELIALDTWCENTIGKRFKDWYSYNFRSNTRIYAFKDESTLLIFKLAWGHYGTW